MKNVSNLYRQLLAAVDLGDATDLVVARAVDIGHFCGADVDLAHVLEGLPTYLDQAVSSNELDEILDKGTRWNRERMAELKARQPGIREIHGVTGILADGIRDLIARIEADLLLVGAHDRRGVAVLFRDRSDEILHRAPCDTLVVKKEGPAQSYGHLLAAIDLTGEEARIVERAAGLAGVLGADLTLMHVIEHFPVDRSNQIIPPEDEDPLAFEREQTLSRLRELAQTAGVGDCGQEAVVSATTANREIPTFAAAKGVDLILVGSHGRHGLGRLLGSTADGIVHRASCDVLVVRQPTA
jgi:universal stress protein A